MDFEASSTTPSGNSFLTIDETKPPEPYSRLEFDHWSMNVEFNVFDRIVNSREMRITRQLKSVSYGILLRPPGKGWRSHDLYALFNWPKSPFSWLLP
jgi:hypothetical protein